MRKTPLYDKHVALGGRIVDFSGWALPVQYSGIVEEHLATRNAAGLFDVSHMGEITVEGKDALKFIDYLITNDVTKLVPQKVMYSPMCYEHGGAVDDLLIYMHDESHFLLVVNAANKDKDYQWIADKSKKFDVKVEDVSDSYAQIALQGPKAEAILQKLTDVPLSDMKFYTFKDNASVGGARLLLSRTGYTGEDGFELYLSPADACSVWDKLLEAGKDEGLLPAGLGARDTLRFEACLPLYGQELSEEITPLEAGLGFFVKLTKGDFIGKAKLLEQKEKGLKRKIAGLEMVEKGVPRHGYEVRLQGKRIGTITSGSFAPYLEKYLALALLDMGYTEIGQEVYVDIRGKERLAKVVETPFYKRRYKR